MSDAAPGRELVRVGEATLSRDEINRVATVGNNLAKSGLFPDAQDGYKAFAKIMLGRSIGLGAMQSMTGIHIVEGKPMLAATTLAGFVRGHPAYDYSVIEHDETKCAIEFFRTTTEPQRESLGTSIFTIEEAQAAGLGKWPDQEKWGKSQWGKWPRNMLFARALSNGIKWFAPDLFGGVPVYTEADEFVAHAALTAGEGDGEPAGIELPAEVEAVIERAQDVGHAGYSDRASVEMAIGGRDPEAVAAWVAEADAALNRAADEAADAEPTDAELVEDGGES